MITWLRASGNLSLAKHDHELIYRDQLRQPIKTKPLSTAQHKLRMNAAILSSRSEERAGFVTVYRSTNYKARWNPLYA